MAPVLTDEPPDLLGALLAEGEIRGMDTDEVRVAVRLVAEVVLDVDKVLVVLDEEVVAVEVVDRPVVALVVRVVPVRAEVVVVGSLCVVVVAVSVSRKVFVVV